MRILVLSNMYPSPEYRSFGIFVERITAGLRNNEAIVDEVVVTRKSNMISRLCAYILFFVRASYKIAFLKYDVFYFHYPTYTLFPYKIFGRLSSAKVVLNFHGTDLMSQTGRGRFLKYFFRKQIEHSDLVISPSSYFLDEIKKVYKIKNELISASGGIEDIFFNKNLTISVSSESNNFVFGFLSRINKSKGWDVAFDAFENLCSELPADQTPELIFAGPVFDTEKFHERLRNTRYKVNYVGELDGLGVVNFFKGINCFVFPTLLPESLGLVALEALASSVPVVASRIGAIPEYVNSQNGMLFLPGDSCELKDCMKLFYQLEVEELTKRRQLCILTAENYRSDTVSRELFTVLSDLIAR